MFVQPGINDGADQIVVIFMRHNMHNIVSNSKSKYR